MQGTVTDARCRDRVESWCEVGEHGNEAASQDPVGGHGTEAAPRDPVGEHGPEVASRDPVGGHSTEAASWDPMGEHGTEVASQDPMGGNGTEAASRDPGAAVLEPTSAASSAHRGRRGQGRVASSPGHLGARAEVQGAHGAEDLDAAHVLPGERTGVRCQPGKPPDLRPFSRRPCASAIAASGVKPYPPSLGAPEPSGLRHLEAQPQRCPESCLVHPRRVFSLSTNALLASPSTGSFRLLAAETAISMKGNSASTTVVVLRGKGADTSH
ncbi:hypothetical protein P7K49_032670 [Saguinus oedipus]|uniref:Uncharacterized protein n=1 Tax=Saguinus oedipus TaxID=9490 RepID=A0ABQ9TPR7_SAGOE|nr:hypothetical protein P7K49_032670 [Saguinus oedipus]